MTLVDTSAWIEYLRATGSDAHLAVRTLLDSEATGATTDVVVMELLAGARSESHASELRRLLLSTTHLPIRGLADFEAGSELYRECRRRGVTPRSVNDCLIAAIAIREGARLLHHDRDFDSIARCTDLQLTS